MLEPTDPWSVHPDITDCEVNGWGEIGDSYCLRRCHRCARRYLFQHFYDVFFRRGSFCIICSPCIVQVVGNLAEKWSVSE